MRLSGPWIVGITTVFIACVAIKGEEPTRDAVFEGQVGRRLSESDLIVLAEVRTSQYVQKLARIEDGEIHADLFTYGRLITLALIDVYESRHSDIPDSIYVFMQEPRRLRDVRLLPAEKYILFLKATSPPDILAKGIETSPELPEKSYYAIIGGRDGAVAKSDVHRFERLDVLLRTTSGHR